MQAVMAQCWVNREGLAGLQAVGAHPSALTCTSLPQNSTGQELIG